MCRTPETLFPSIQIPRKKNPNLSNPRTSKITPLRRKRHNRLRNRNPNRRRMKNDRSSGRTNNGSKTKNPKLIIGKIKMKKGKEKGNRTNIFSKLVPEYTRLRFSPVLMNARWFFRNLYRPMIYATSVISNLTRRILLTKWIISDVHPQIGHTHFSSDVDWKMVVSSGVFSSIHLLRTEPRWDIESATTI